MKKIICIFLIILFIFSISACSKSEAEQEPSTSETVIVPDKEGRGNEAGSFSQTLLPIPDEYLNSAESTTPSEELVYTHKDHTKSAIVYLPPNYDSEKQYNVLYIIGGVHADETAFFNNAGDDATLKNILDNMILNGEIQPCIAVNMAFYPTDDVTLGDMSLEAMLDDFEDELRNVVIPAVETKYSTYADSSSEEDIIASRKHRAFAGFSMGGAVGWFTLTQSVDYFYYFAPMAAGSFEDYDNDYKGDTGRDLSNRLNELGYANNEFFVFASEGTKDVTYEKMELLMNRFRNDYTDVFIFTDSEKAGGNITYKTKEGAEHEYSNAYQYLYNSLRAFWS